MDEEVLWGKVQDLMKEVEHLKTKVFDSFGSRIAQCESSISSLDTRTKIFVPVICKGDNEIRGTQAMVSKFVTYMDKTSREVSKLKAKTAELERVNKA